ncbi:hypothetical protein CTAYLR_003908, partial [Chrysophaeum taylorii]
IMWSLCVAVMLSAASTRGLDPPRVLVVGGTGRIGTAVAVHLLQRERGARVVLAGRDKERGRRAVAEVLTEARGAAVEFSQFDYRSLSVADLAGLFRSNQVDAVVHVAGPFYGVVPTVLDASIEAGVRVYADVSDPLEYIEMATRMDQRALAAGTSAILCAGAFPGMSNVLAVEAATTLGAAPRDLNFSYFTAGLGGSGALNLEITNFGFGGGMTRVVDGRLVDSRDLPGTDLGRKTFPGLGRKEVWAWPFPECATVAKELGISGSSVAGMGTAPTIWNGLLRALVGIVPRKWWTNPLFSVGLARFSEPLVRVTDAFVGETHAMRIDVSSATSVMTVVQAHESFRRCVGQSCAEFCLDLLAHPRTGVHLPESLYRDDSARARIVDRLTSTPGTTAFQMSKSD